MKIRQCLHLSESYHYKMIIVNSIRKDHVKEIGGYHMLLRL
jgi:hypothetical protein